MRAFAQRDYTEAVHALDRVFNVFFETTGDEHKARVAMAEFVTRHYFEVWREMSPVTNSDQSNGSDHAD